MTFHAYFRVKDNWKGELLISIWDKKAKFDVFLPFGGAWYFEELIKMPGLSQKKKQQLPVDVKQLYQKWILYDPISLLLFAWL